MTVSMKVPLLDLAAQHDPLQDKILEALKRVLQSEIFIMGPEVDNLELAVASYSRTKFAIGVSSGTDALLVALLALDIGPGDEVITTSYSFFATAGAIARVGARPVFVDIDPVSFNIDPIKTAAVVTSKTRAIIPVHLFGQCADMNPLLELSRTRKISLIEDAAQAIGAEYKDGRKAGSMGTAGCFSFFPSKNLGALGDGGMVVTSDVVLAEKIRALRVHGSKQKYYHKWVGGNFRLDAIQAAILNVKLPHLDPWSRQRQENAKRYEELFKTSRLLEKGFVSLPKALYQSSGHDLYHIYNQFVIRARNRDALRNHLKDQGIGAEVYYPLPLHLQECFQSLGYKNGSLPESEKAAVDTLAIPIYPQLTAPMQAAVVESIADFYKRS